MSNGSLPSPNGSGEGSVAPSASLSPRASGPAAPSTGNLPASEPPAADRPVGIRAQVRLLWHRCAAHVRAQLTQGTSPNRLAFTFGVGAACSLFPFLGFTSLLNLGVGLALRLNQPILQALNQLLGPVQLILIVPYVRLGEKIWGDQGTRFTVSEILDTFRQGSIAEFFERFGWAGVHAFTAWAVSLPFVIPPVVVASRRILRTVHSLRDESSPAADNQKT